MKLVHDEEFAKAEEVDRDKAEVVTGKPKRANKVKFV